MFINIVFYFVLNIFLLKKKMYFSTLVNFDSFVLFYFIPQYFTRIFYNGND
jgi:hypothetical protein